MTHAMEDYMSISCQCFNLFKVLKASYDGLNSEARLQSFGFVGIANDGGDGKRIGTGMLEKAS